ncbi:MAG: 30S ribosomal protein S16 [Lentimicrobium sp.]
MAVRMRLQRFGKKGQPFYHIVVADGRAPRDGRFIEKLGTYNPLTNPADIKIDMDRAIYWLNVGAQPTDTVKALLSYKGVLLRRHLLRGVEKGALTSEQAEAKFQEWMEAKETRIKAKISQKVNLRREHLKNQQEAERKIAEERAQQIAKKRSANAPSIEAPHSEETENLPASVE